MDKLRVLSSPRRLEVLGIVWDEERTAGEIAAAFDVTWGAISQHIRVLREAGYLIERREGRTRHYRADTEALGMLRIVVEDHWRTSLTRLKFLAEAEQRKKDRDK